MSLMGIGDFAARSRLSHKALRLYDELRLLIPARVDPGSGYRWYAQSQLDRARLVANLRGLGMPLARIRAVLDLDSSDAADQVAEYWTVTETEHAARRDLAGYLIDHLNGKEPAMYEVGLREMPERSMLCLLMHAHTDELIATGRDLMARLRPVAKPSPGDPLSAPFIIFHGEVSTDSDGPAEWCWPVPADEAERIAAQFPDLRLRTEAAHQEAFVDVGLLAGAGAQFPQIWDSLFGWVTSERREPAGGLRQIMIANPANDGKGPDGQYAFALK